LAVAQLRLSLKTYPCVLGMLPLNKTVRALTFLFLPFLISVGSQAADVNWNGALNELSEFSSFTTVAADDLIEGEILSQRGSLLELRRGMHVETLCLVDATSEETVRLGVTWNPTQHPSLQIFRHVGFDASNPTEAFQTIWPKDPASSVRWLLKNSLNFKPENNPFFIGPDEQKKLQAALQAAPSELGAENGWKEILRLRSELPPQDQPHYSTDDGVSTAAQEIKLIMAERPNILVRFNPLLQRIQAEKPEKNYWELVELTGTGQSALVLGGTYVQRSNNHVQLADFQYFISNGYFASLSLYEFWPVEIGGEKKTLLWRGDYLSAPSIALTRGVERMVTGQLMVKEIKDAISCFRKDIKTPKP
jgi:hypothetical protein